MSGVIYNGFEHGSTNHNNYHNPFYKCVFVFRRQTGEGKWRKCAGKNLFSGHSTDSE